MQRHHHNTEFIKRTHPITIVCDNVINAPNVGGILRIADAFGIKQVIFCGERIQFGKRMKKTSRSTENHVAHTIHKDVLQTVFDLKQANNFIIALEITANSKSLQDFRLSTEKPIVLIIGNENFGITEEVLQLADSVLHIDMYGHNSSMNVTQATSIALYEMTKQLK
ncbi:MAG: TrmH family RNA methyltransferase [Winogradskyella sp.]|nr:TrmH family RNA methyltransferase [Winogradskyella sp.]